MTEEINIKKRTLFSIVGILVIGIFIFVALWNVMAGDDTSGLSGELVAGGTLGSNKIYLDGNTQVVTLGVANYNYDPETITVEAGKPVRIVGNMEQLQGCLRAFTIPRLGISKVFKSGDNVLEFTPAQKGTFGFSCSMGMGTGSLIVS